MQLDDIDQTAWIGRTETAIDLPRLREQTERIGYPS